MPGPVYGRRDLKQHLQRIPGPQHITQQQQQQQQQQQPQQPAGTSESLYGKVDAMLLDLGVSSMQVSLSVCARMVLMPVDAR
jgi:16S rRNA C1402 N4-methylase RsmH